MKSVITTCILFFIILLAFSQEQADTLNLKSAPPGTAVQSFSFDQSFELEYPLSSSLVVNQQMIYQLFEYDNENSKGYEFVITPFNSLYWFSKNGYTFWQNSEPLSLGFSYHLNKLARWKKLDFFVDGSGFLYNDNFPTKPEVVPGQERGFIWETGIGAGYKISSRSTVFIKGSVLMNSTNRIGGRDVGGMNVKF